jgi:outer membrane protein insertion porin family
VAVNFQRYQLDNANFFFIINNGNSTNLNLSLDLSRSSIDQPLYPKSGSLLSFQVTATLPYSLMFKNRRDINYADPELPSEERYKWIEYHKWKITAEWYVNIVQNLVFKTSAKLGFLGLYNKKLGFSPFERFEVGGDGLSNTQILGRDIISMRGYPIFTPSGGAPIFNKFSMELRYPISLNPSATIFALAFAEAGNYWTDIRNYRPYDLARSVGMGVRVFLPMFGLLGFDYGIGFDRDKLGLLPKQGNNIFARYGEFRIILGFEPQ